MDTNLTGKVALVTGASQGIGEAIARALHREGAHVALVARTQAKLDALARALGDRAVAVAADVRDAADLSAAIAAAEQRLGPIDIAVNNAGGIITSDGELFRPFEAVSDADWIGTFELNVMSAVRVSRALAPKMAARGWGRIINISSESGVQPDPVAVEYAAAKGALNAMTKALSKAYGGRGVLVNAVSPAYIDTPVVRSVLAQMPGGDTLAPDQLTQQYLGQFRPNIVVGHAGTADEVAAAVVFLASDAASFVTGTNLRVDGGSVATV
ncbi:ketoacyl reductase [Gemmatimonadetes bacterium T265]|nr:ketoacyl reductase [Gemmatimonadetes bacterium T265]